MRSLASCRPHVSHAGSGVEFLHGDRNLRELGKLENVPLAKEGGIFSDRAGQAPQYAAADGEPTAASAARRAALILTDICAHAPRQKLCLHCCGLCQILGWRLADGCC